MGIKKIIGLAAAGVAVYLYDQTKKQEEQVKKMREDHEKYVAALLAEKEELENKIDPNGNADKAPVVFTVTMYQGGVTLNQTEIYLNCTNKGKVDVELGDFQAFLWLAGVKSLKLMPANIGSFKVSPGRTVSFRLYAGDGIVIQDYVDCKKRLNYLGKGESTSVMKSGLFIPLYREAVLMNIQYLWYFSGGETKCYAFDVPGTYTWKYAGWVHGTNAGYNAANEKEQKKNPSTWVDMSELED